MFHIKPPHTDVEFKVVSSFRAVNIRRCNVIDRDRREFSGCGGERNPQLISVDLAQLWASVLL